jgi:hypothetical protein
VAARAYARIFSIHKVSGDASRLTHASLVFRPSIRPSSAQEQIPWTPSLPLPDGKRVPVTTIGWRAAGVGRCRLVLAHGQGFPVRLPLDGFPSAGSYLLFG